MTLYFQEQLEEEKRQNEKAEKKRRKKERRRVAKVTVGGAEGGEAMGAEETLRSCGGCNKVEPERRTFKKCQQ